MVLSVLFVAGRLCAATAVAPASGDGSSPNPYHIASLENLYWIAQNPQHWGASFLQTASIDASDTATWDDGDGGLAEGWTPVGNTDARFHGFYDGQGYTIAGLTINRPVTPNVGLFGHVGHVESATEATTVRRVRLTGSHVVGARGSGTLIGRVTGNANTVIEECSSSGGSVCGDGATGGLIGSHNSYRETPGGEDNPVARRCFAEVDVFFSGAGGADKFGGLAGCSQKGTLSNCYARGSVTATNATRIGGLAGCIDLRGELVRSYSTGSVLPTDCTLYGGLVGNLSGSGGNQGVVTACFWDQETSAQTTSAGGVGKTTAEMKSELVFTAAGWQFPAVWTIDAVGLVNGGYPHLVPLMETPEETVPGFAIGAVCALGANIDSRVPWDWNIGPLREGAWREDFEDALPAWAAAPGSSGLTTNFPSLKAASFPVRTNAWFDPGTQVLRVEVPAGSLSNHLAYVEAAGGGAVTFSARPVYVDLLAHLEATAVGREPEEMLQGWSLGLFLDAQNHLVALDGTGVTVSAESFATGIWRRVTFRLEASAYSVQIDGLDVFSGLELRDASNSVLGSLCMRGDGWLDELYVGHGAPDYAVAGPTESLPPLPDGGGPNAPTDEQRTRLNVWLQNYGEIDIQPDTKLAMTLEQLCEGFLIGELAGDADIVHPVGYAFGISAIDMHFPSLLQLTARLATDAGPKQGPINGRIQVQGKVSRSDPEWQTFAKAITPEFAHFTNGEAVYDYAIPDGGYRIFRALIVP